MSTIAEKLAYLAETKNLLKAALESRGVTVPDDATFRDYVTMVEGLSAGSDAATYMLITEDGAEIPAVVVEEETVFTATANDIREGTVAATSEGVTTGTKVIPAYHTTESVQVVRAGCNVEINNLSSCDCWDFTKLQAIICPFNTSVEDSVAAEKVAIEGSVYAVQSTEALATVTKDIEGKIISFGIVNTGETPLLIRYFTYKEEI